LSENSGERFQRILRIERCEMEVERDGVRGVDEDGEKYECKDWF
jgi:hypothetical protein